MKLDADSRAIDSIQLIRKQHGVTKRLKAHRINEWNCQLLKRTLVYPNKTRNLRETLLRIEQSKIVAAHHVARNAQTTSEKKKATQTKGKDMDHHVFLG